MTTEGRRTAVRLVNDVRVRGARPGDRIDIDGGTTPVAEVLRAAGVPPRRRPFLMTVTVGGKIAALDGIRVAPWARPGIGETAIVIEREGPA